MLDIVDALDTNGISVVYEVGPGTGVLTKYLLDISCPFEAIDVDIESIEFLIKNYPDHAPKFQQKNFIKMIL